MKKRLFLAGLNLIAPGIGQMFGDYKIRGACELSAAIFLFLWCLGEAIGPIIKSVINMISGNGAIECIHFWRLAAAMLLLILLYIYSIVEIAILAKDEDEAGK